MRARWPWLMPPLLLAGCFPVGVLVGPDHDSGGETGDACPTWYQDADGDGYGDPDATVVACEQPSGTVDDNSDCDDSDPDVHPGATEICHDGADNDCDGTANHCTLSGIESLSSAQG